jgi:fucose permease
MRRSRASTLLVILAYVGFVSLGLPDGLLGVSTPSIRATFALAPQDYTGTEATAGVWSYSVLTQARGVPAATAGFWVSLFWIGLTLGRFGFVAEHAPMVTLLRASLVAIALGTALFALNLGAVATVVGLTTSGFAMAPIFPSLIAMTPARLGARHTGNAVGFQVAAAILGAAWLPSLVGVLVGRFGLEAVGWSLLAAALGLITLHEVLQRSVGQAAQPIG